MPRSHPTRGGWIEIDDREAVEQLKQGPTPHGVGGLKSTSTFMLAADSRPTPHGVGGLKSAFVSPLHEFDVSHPTRGGWIEIKKLA